jgi:putative glutamine amidotransferase
MPRPIVGVTGGALTAERQRKQHVLRAALHAAGCVPVLLRPEEGSAAIGRVHGLVLPGGGDIDPRRYGEEPSAGQRDPDPEREEFEIGIAREAVATGVPILGICLGLQVLVVALGGRLRTDVPGHEGEGATHDVPLDPASNLARLLGTTSLVTNTNHHQAPSELPPLLAASGRTGDGVIEAVEGPGFTVGVGWHPETLGDAASRRLFDAFVAAATRRAIEK